MRDGFKDKSINLVVSSCLLGNSVRYDGLHQFHELINKSLSEEFNIIPVCPEVMAGLTVPRPPVQLVKQESKIQAIGVEDNLLNVTDKLLTASNEFIDNMSEVCGFILKARSPSCGVDTTPILNENLIEIKTSNGLFAGQVIKNYPDMPITDESTLTNQNEIDSFLNQVRKYYLTQHNTITNG